MFKKTYEHLKYSGLDVYSIGQHKGLCEKPYIVIKENGLSEISGTSLTNDIIELLVYYPVGSYTKLEEYKKLILSTMKSIKGFRRIIDPAPTVIDEHKKAYTTSYYYRKIKVKEGV